MLQEVKRTDLFCEYYKKWVAVYKYTVIHPYYSNFKPPFPAARF